ncbi:MAG TPA: ABC transporter permease [Isosphaeraceae bacterium]|jgi:putative ABC transport system permease protein|nr:ABC transporter permease [Isosphaeraceae bacterium]
MIPLKYNLRNLRVRWVTTLMTVMGTGAVIWCSCILFGLVDGLQHSLNISGDPTDLIILRKGSTNETSGAFSLDTAQKIATLKGIAHDESGAPMVALELLNIPVTERVDGSHTNLIVRGVDPASPLLRPNFKIIEGRYFTRGKDECVVSRNISKRFKNAQLGGLLRVGDKEAYRVVGLFTAGGSAAESEVWVDRQDLVRHTAFGGFVSCAQLRASSAADMEQIRQTLIQDTQFKLLAQTEQEYFSKQDRSGLFLKVFGTVIAILLTIGAMFSAANTMFAAVSARTREIGTMRALGFTRFDVLLSFMGESILLCTLGGLLGLLATLPLSALSFGIMNQDSFAEVTVNFHLGPMVMGVAFAMTAAMGLFGGLFPALRAVNLDVIKALREL